MKTKARQARSRPGSVELTAVHEAAHAVVALRAGLFFEEVTIQPSTRLDGKGVAGRLVHLMSNKWPDQDERIQVAFAGTLAERLLCGTWPDMALLRARGDFRGVLAEAGSKRNDRQYLLGQARQAGATVAAHWPDVRRVANRLRERVTLGCDEVEALLGTAGSDGPACRWHANIATKVIDFLMDERLRTIFNFGLPSDLSDVADG